MVVDLLVLDVADQVGFFFDRIGEGAIAVLPPVEEWKLAALF